MATNLLCRNFQCPLNGALCNNVEENTTYLFFLFAASVEVWRLTQLWSVISSTSQTSDLCPEFVFNCLKCTNVTQCNVIDWLLWIFGAYLKVVIQKPPAKYNCNRGILSSHILSYISKDLYMPIYSTFFKEFYRSMLSSISDILKRGRI
jgi:hypothetical protein